MNYIDGGVCAPKGFKAAGVHCGIRSTDTEKKDLALIVSEGTCNAAAVYTQNKVQGAPIAVTKEHLKDGNARAIICNSGNANTCAAGGVSIARHTCRLAADHLGIREEDVIVCSTGVIGEVLSIDPFQRGMEPLVKALDEKGGTMAAEAMMTTDTVPKEAAVEFQLGDCTCHMGAAAKGSGMINPNMATMLGFITTDADISCEMLQKALSEDVKDTFNQLSVDGDTSTNDTVAIMANGLAGNDQIQTENEDFHTFCKALNMVTKYLVKLMGKDGEGATTLTECLVTGAPDTETARSISKAVISSDLLKTAIFGRDANWGRILCAVGYAQGDFRVDDLDVTLSSEKGEILVCKGSSSVEFSETKATKILDADEVRIHVEMKQGTGTAAAWGCDLSYEYVRINGDYRS